MSHVSVRLTWLMLFRAVVIAALLVSTVAIRFGTGEDVFGPGSIVVYGACSTSYAAILAGALWLHRAKTGVLLVAHLQLLWDAIFATLLAVATGGVGSAFAFLYFLTVLVAASVVGRRGVLVVAAECAALYTLVLGVELAGLLRRFGAPFRPNIDDLALPFLTNVLGMFLVAILAGYLTEQLRRTSESLTATQVHLYHLEELYAAVLRSLPSGVLTVDDKDVILYVNDAGAHIVGHDARELVGRQMSSVSPELPTQSKEDDALGKQRFEVTLQQGAAAGRVLGGSIAKLTGVEEVAGSVVVFQDLTELRRLQRDIARADRLATIGRFAAGLAHEIRNPLAAMIGCLELLQADINRPTNERGTEGGRMLGIVHREAERLSNLVTAFLTYARPQPPDSVQTDVAELVEEVARTAQVGAPDLLLDVVADAHPMAPVDPEQIRQVVWNLVGNAVEAARVEDQPGAKLGVVRVTVEEHGEDAVITVEDDGPGVPEDLRASIFEPFFTTRSNGTGLGLATCHQIVEAHGGHLEVASSTALGGARFTVRLPLYPGQRPIDRLSDPAIPVVTDDEIEARMLEPVR